MWYFYRMMWSQICPWKINAFCIVKGLFTCIKVILLIMKLNTLKINRFQMTYIHEELIFFCDINQETKLFLIWNQKTKTFKFSCVHVYSSKMIENRKWLSYIFFPEIIFVAYSEVFFYFYFFKHKLWTELRCQNTSVYVSLSIKGMGMENTMKML